MELLLRILDDKSFHMFILGFLGALSFEALKAYKLRAKLYLKKYQRVYKSWIFWGTVIGMCLASGFFAWAINSGHPDASVWQVVISGIGANSFVSKAIEAKGDEVKLGDSDSLSFKDLFV